MTALDLAWAGLNPERVDKLVERHGSVAAVVRDLGIEAVDPDSLSKRSITFLTDDLFPSGLRGLPGGPRWLFQRGSLPNSEGVAVVGSRKATRYGLELAELIGARLGRAGRVVVSGLAKGIDGAAHRGCLEVGGTTVAVLGSGIDVWYPARHQNLGEQIIAGGGAVVSEFPPGTPPEPWRFPARNRIISGLCRVVVVVEAAVRSGALITARIAVDQGREVFAVPGDIDRSTSRGCNQLIRDGAHPVTDVDEIVEMVEFILGPSETDAKDASPSLVEVFGVAIGLAKPIAEIVEETGRGASETLIELGRLEAAGSIRIDTGMVSTRLGR